MKTSIDSIGNLVHPWDAMVSHQFTGMDIVTQTALTKIIKLCFPAGALVFCSMEHEEFLQSTYGDDVDAIYKWCLAQQRTCKKIVFLIAPGPESLGMQYELAQAKQDGQEIIVCVHTAMTKAGWVQQFCQSATIQIVWGEAIELRALEKILALSAPRHKAG